MKDEGGRMKDEMNEGPEKVGDLKFQAGSRQVGDLPRIGGRRPYRSAC